MIKRIILKEYFQPVIQLNEKRFKFMFKVEDMTNPVYKKDNNDNIIVDENNNPIIDYYEDTEYCIILECYFIGNRTEAAIRKLIADWYDLETDQKILNGFVWNGKPVYLSSENQFNFKAAYDIAAQTLGQNLPITFKLGEKNGIPVYHSFEEMTEFTDFYTKAVAFINQTLAEGWKKKDSFDWSLYVDTSINEEI